MPNVDWLLRAGSQKDHQRSRSCASIAYAMLRAVQSGLGMAALPDFMARESSALVRVLPELQGPRIDAYFVYPEEMRHSKRVPVFRDFLLGKVAESKMAPVAAGCTLRLLIAASGCYPPRVAINLGDMFGMQPSVADLIVSFVPFLILTSLPFAIGAFYLAPKMGRNPWLWAILLFIPIVNLIVIYIFFFLVMGAMLDRLNVITDRMKNVTPFS